MFHQLSLLSARWANVSTKHAGARALAISGLTLLWLFADLPLVQARAQVVMFVFPDSSIGTVYSRKGDARSGRFPARGRVTVPVGDVYIELNQFAVDNPTCLSALKLDGLYGLDLSKARLTDRWLSNIQSMKNIRQLSLRGTGVTDNGIAYLSTLPKLERLDITRTKIQGRNLGQLAHLKWLSMGENQYDDPAVFSQLAKLNQLELLGLTYSRLNWLKRTPKLTVEQSDVILSNSIGALKSLRKLETIYFEGLPLSSQSWKFLKNLPNLSAIKATATEMDSKSLTYLNPSTVEHLDIEYCRRVDDSAAPFLQLCDRLNYLNISHTGLTGSGFEKIRGPKLSRLWLGELDLHSLQNKLFASMPNILSLSLSNTGFTDVGIKSICKLKRVEQLDLSSNELTDICVPDLACMKSLSVLDVSDTNISSSGLKRLKSALPRCRIIWG